MSIIMVSVAVAVAVATVTITIGATQGTVIIVDTLKVLVIAVIRGIVATVAIAAIADTPILTMAVIQDTVARMNRKC